MEAINFTMEIDIDEVKELKPYIKQYIRADEFVNGKVRYCLWFSEQTPESILECVKGRLEKVATFRNNSSKKRNKHINSPLVFDMLIIDDFLYII